MTVYFFTKKLIIYVLAPSAYKSESVKLDHTPAYSFGIKVNHKKSSDAPGIGIYI